MDKIEINLDMTKLQQDYPATSLPSKLNKRTGNAKKCKFEKLDATLYDPSASMLAFYTNIDRLQAWIKTLDILYYDNLGKEGSEFRVVWLDVPSEWRQK